MIAIANHIRRIPTPLAPSQQLEFNKHLGRYLMELHDECMDMYIVKVRSFGNGMLKGEAQELYFQIDTLQDAASDALLARDLVTLKRCLEQMKQLVAQ
jgi:hypothetical protein